MQQNIYKTIKILFLISSIFTVGCAERLAAPMGGPWMNYDRRSVGTLTEDQKISVKANVALTKNKDIWKQSHISTLSYNNSILLVGQTPEEDNIETVEAELRDIPEIKNVYNQISVGSPISLKQRALDTWITTQVKAKLVSNRNIGPNRVKVITENSTVYLMGILTRDEEELATDITRRISGVNQVVKVLDRFEDMA